MAAQRQEKVVVEGDVIRIDRTAGEFTGNDGAPVVYDFTEIKVLTADSDVVIVRFPKGHAVPVPVKGETVRLHCDARAAQGNVKLTVERRDDYTHGQLAELLGQRELTNA